MSFDLSAYSEEFRNTEVENYEDPGEGRFQVRFKKIELKTTKNGNPSFSIMFKIVNGDKRGMTFFQNQVITRATEEKKGTIKIIKGNFKAIGFTGDIDEWYSRAAEWIDTAIEVQRTANGTDNQGNPQYNVYWKKALDIPITDGVNLTPPMDASPF